MPSDSKLLLKTPKTPRPMKAGILLAGPDDGVCSLEKDAWLHGCLALGPADLESMPLEAWTRCLLLTAVSRSTQHAYMADVLGEQMVFPEEIHSVPLVDGTALTVVAFNVKLLDNLKMPRKPGVFHVQAACLAHRSALLEITCG